jgi:hypothetical protein
MTRACMALIVTGAFLMSDCPAATKGVIDEFSSPGTAGWGSQIGNSNPGTGGVGGVSDGFLLLSSDFESNFGSASSDPGYTGDWIAAGVTEVSFYLNDVGTPQPFEFHLLVTGGPLGATTWQHNTGFQPPSNAWQRYVVDVTSAANWTQIRGTASFTDVLHAVSRMHFRHDLPSFFSSPDPVAGDLGVDRIALGPTCHTPPQDINGDGSVDGTDFGAFSACFNGTGNPTAPTCDCFDSDGDGDVDGTDYGAFGACFNGTGNPPNC